MTDQIIIEGDRIRTVRMEILSETALDAIAPHLVTRLPSALPVLPQHPVRHIFFDPNNGRGHMLVETTPRTHTLQVRHSSGRFPEDATRRDPDGLSRFQVMLPYQYFAYAFSVNIGPRNQYTDFTILSGFLFWSNAPLRTPEDRLWVASIPNVDSHGSICWGSTQSDSTSLAARIDDLINNFYTTVFNEDLGHRTPYGTSLLEWERNSTGLMAYRNFPIWTPETSFSLDEVAVRISDVPVINIAELNPSFSAIPELPSNFTIGRAREWLDSLEPRARMRISAAMAMNPETDEEDA